MWQKIRNFAWRLCEDTENSLGRNFNLLMMGLILVSTLIWLLESHKDLPQNYRQFLIRVENGIMLCFMAEYVLRYLAYQSSFWRYAQQPMAIIDLLAIVPYFITAQNDFVLLRLLRLFRIFRLLKLVRHSEAVQNLVLVFRLNGSVLGAFLFVVVVILFLAAALMHALEPERFAQMSDALWWAIVTLTTVGYGDLVPETLAGKFTAAILMLLGIGLIALPTGVLGAAMTKLMLEKKKAFGKKLCPRCGEEEHPPQARFCHRCGKKLVA
ncbi:MAG: ion transporter [Turneriella sp.]|nr:ion transporter [Leptospiraceae bacterium]MCX7631935.1 ion transporter [Turneriella sp.]